MLATAGVAAVVAAVVGLLLPTHRHGPAATAPPTGGLPVPRYTPAQPPPAWPGPLPYPILIADRGDHRLLEVTPAGRTVWQYPATADADVPASSVSFSPDGRSVVATGEHVSVIERIDYYARTVTWHFGTPGTAGSGSSLLNYPSDAHLLPNGNTIVADIRNCRELTIDADGHVVATWGKPQAGYCLTDPTAGKYGYPSGDAPQANGDILMAFASGYRIALLSSQGKVHWNVASPNLYGGTVADAELLSTGQVLVTGYAKPGAVVLFAPGTGHVAWQYHVTSGPGALADPTQALVMPGGNVLVADTDNNRVVVIDPHTGAIVWQYTGLHSPTGVALDTWRDWRGQSSAADAAGRPSAPS